MAKLSDIHTFAVFWTSRFKNPDINYAELVDHCLADDCAALGFEMDSGKAFGEKYGAAVYDVKPLMRIIDSVDDIPLLGSAIYSRWRYFNHWAYDAREILERENLEWFITALGRLDELSGENFTISTALNGRIRKIRIWSNAWGLTKFKKIESGQQLTITRAGWVYFSSYALLDDEEKHRKKLTRNFKAGEAKAERIMTLFEKHFSVEHGYGYVADVGDWRLEITNSEGKSFVFRGSLWADTSQDGVDLSEFVRDELEMQNLLIFDNNFKPDKVNRIALSYHREKVPSCEEYNEILILDRKTETIELTEHSGKCFVSRTYHAEGELSAFLDNLEAHKLFANIDGNREDAASDQTRGKKYSITVDYKKGPQKIISGAFDKNGLPDDYKSFIKGVQNFMKRYGKNEIFNAAIYSRPQRRKGELIFCYVSYGGGGKTYCYLTEDDSLEVGDAVVVPVGDEERETMARIAKIAYFPPDNAPFPLERVKRVIRKA